MVRGALRKVLYPPHLRRTGALALVVGSWLTLFNQGTAILSGELGVGLWTKVILNYLTPLIVANLGLLFRRPENPEDAETHAIGKGQRT